VTFSRRSSPDAAPNALAVALARARAEARPVLDLTESNPTRAGIPYAEAAILESLGDRRALVYEPHPFGLPGAREHVAREIMRAGAPMTPASQIVLTASTSEAYAFLFKLLCDPGDEVLVPQPSYPLFDLLARFESVRLVPYPLLYDGAWHVDVDALRRAVGPRTRAVLAVSPNNPTGSYLKRGELAAIEALGLPLICDEVFASYPLTVDPARAATALEARANLVLALGGLSKLAALPQMKLAWIEVGGPASEVTAALGRLELIADSFLSVGAPVQHAVKALLASGRTAADAIRERTGQNLGVLRAALRGAAASLLHVEGGWYATLQLPRTQSEERWALDLLALDGVYVHPAHFFDFADEAYIILSLLTQEAIFAEGLDRICARVARNS
jgi:alanine-synthesizing transaminase